MSIKPIIFEPTLLTPQGINNYSGVIFRCFTKGDSLPFQFTIQDDSGAVTDITGWQAFITMSDVVSCNEAGCTADSQIIEVEIPITDAVNGVFSGSVSGAHTQSLACGLNYASAKYIDGDGLAHIIDMCVLEVYPNLTYDII